jgi:putative transposase
MKKTRFSEEQIIAILKEVDSGIAVTEVCRKYNISNATVYKWKSKYSGMVASDVKKMRQMEEENNKLKRLVAEQMLDIQALKSVISKNF